MVDFDPAAHITFDAVSGYRPAANRLRKRSCFATLRGNIFLLNTEG
jgi:hypothetical protein